MDGAAVGVGLKEQLPLLENHGLRLHAKYQLDGRMIAELDVLPDDQFEILDLRHQVTQLPVHETVQILTRPKHAMRAEQVGHHLEFRRWRRHPGDHRAIGPALRHRQGIAFGSASRHAGLGSGLRRVFARIDECLGPLDNDLSLTDHDEIASFARSRIVGASRTTLVAALTETPPVWDTVTMSLLTVVYCPAASTCTSCLPRATTTL
jgi:hypothetical protein